MRKDSHLNYPLSTDFRSNLREMKHVSKDSIQISILSAEFSNQILKLTLICMFVLLFLLVCTHLEPTGANRHRHVNVNVWRGASKGSKKHKFAPWGYYAKLAADDRVDHEQVLIAK